MSEYSLKATAFPPVQNTHAHTHTHTHTHTHLTGWLAVLAVASLGEQIKTRIEVAEEEKNTKEVSSDRFFKSHFER